MRGEGDDSSGHQTRVRLSDGTLHGCRQEEARQLPRIPAPQRLEAGKVEEEWRPVGVSQGVVRQDSPGNLPRRRKQAKEGATQQR